MDLPPRPIFFNQNGMAMHDLVRDPLVSVVIVNWNYQAFVAQAIDSVIRQTYERIECVIVDNGSTDQSIEVIEKAIACDERFRLLRFDRNLGHFGGAMAALDQLKGRFVAFLDADDYYFPDFLASHIQVHLSAIKPTAFTSSNAAIVDGDGVLISGAFHRFEPGDWRFKANLPEKPQFLIGGVTQQRYDRLVTETLFGGEELGYWFWQPGSSNVMRRELIEILRPDKDKEIPFGGVDTYCLIPLFAITGATVIDESLSAYRLHEANDWGRIPQVNGVLAGNMDAYARNKVLKRLLLTTVIEKAEIISSIINPCYRYFRFLEIVVHNSGETTLLGRESAFSNQEVSEVLARKMPFFVQTWGVTTVSREFRNFMRFKELFRIMSRALKGRARAVALFKVLKNELRRVLGKKKKR